MLMTDPRYDTSDPPVIQRGIYCLPDDLIVAIFIVYSVLVGTSNLKPHWREPHREILWKSYPTFAHANHWVPLMLVCRRWRNVGLATPSLWNVVDVHKSAQRLALAIERSQGAALDVYFHDVSVAVASVPMVTAQAHRLRKLLFPPFLERDVSNVRPLFNVDMPMLEELWVNSHLSRLSAIEPPHFTLYPSGLQLRTLKRLCIGYTSIPWTFQFMFRMRSLHLRGCCIRDTSLDFDSFMNTLQQCSALEELHLQLFVWPVDSNRHVDSLPRAITIPNLRTLYIADKPCLCARFLSCINLSPRIDLTIMGADFMDRSMDLSAVQGLFTSMLPRDPYDRLAILRQATYAEFVTYEREPLIVATSPEGGRIALGLWFDNELHSDIQHYADTALLEFGNLLKNAPLEDVAIYCTPGCELDSPRVWRQVFASLPFVRSLEVAPCCEPHTIFSALGGAHEGQDDPCASERLLPRLRSLRMLQVFWATDAPDILLGCMRDRALRGLPKLERLVAMFAGNRIVWMVEDGNALRRMLGSMAPLYKEKMAPYTAEFVSGYGISYPSEWCV